MIYSQLRAEDCTSFNFFESEPFRSSSWFCNLQVFTGWFEWVVGAQCVWACSCMCVCVCVCVCGDWPWVFFIDVCVCVGDQCSVRMCVWGWFDAQCGCTFEYVWGWDPLHDLWLLYQLDFVWYLIKSI